jgi:serine protease
VGNTETNRNPRMQAPAVRALVIATALALSGMAAPAMADGRVLVDGLRSPQGYDGFIVKYRDGSAERRDVGKMKSALTRVGQGRVAGRALRLGHVRRLALGADLVSVDRKLDRVEAEALMRRLAADPNVEYVEPNLILTHTMTPDDARYGEQWHYNGANGMRVDGAWDAANGNGVVVAVIDTGIVPHPDLDARILPGYDFVSNASNARDGNGRDNNPNDEGDWVASAYECGLGQPNPSNSSWHGTHVAGTIAAVTNNGTGVAGIAYNARVVPVRVLSKCGGTLADIQDGIVWAAGGTVSGVPANANPAEIINLSLGGGSSCPASMQSAVDTAVQRGATVVVAAGNSNRDVAGFMPAGCNNVVAVAASDKEGNRSWFSNYGAKIDVTATGGETCSPNNMNGEHLPLATDPTNCAIRHETKGVLSTLNAGTTTQGQSSYAFYQGTSMAAPHVAGIAALMQSAVSTPLTPAQIEQALKDTVRALPGLCPGGCGAGLVDAQAAVAEAIRIGGGGGGNVAPVAGFSSTVSGLTVSFTDSSSDSDGSIASRSWNFGDGTSSTVTSPTKTYTTAGTYSVTLTVTDNGGATDTETKSVTVTSGGGGNVLANGVAVTGVSGATGSSQYYTLDVPAGASGLKFVTTGGSGDADLYVRFGAQPTTTAFTCKSEGPTNAETCNIATAQAGTYHVLVRGYSAFSGLSLTGSYGTGGGGSQTYTNGTDYTILDNRTVESPITVTGRTGNGAASTSVTVAIAHTFRGDLRIELIAPDGSAYLLKNYNSADSADNVNATYNVNLSGEALNGTWKLRVSDNAVNDTGRIDSWSISF